jgi:hypothetical protein
MAESIDIGKAFSHMFEDEEWTTKAIIGAALSIIPIVNFIVIGYELRLIRKVSQGEDRPMPTWEDMGDLFMEGLQLGLAQIVLTLPIALFFLLPLFGFWFSIFLLPVFAGSAPEAEIERMVGAYMGLGMLGMFGCFGIGMLLSFLMGFVLPAVTANFSRKRTFASCFEVSAILGFIRRNLGNYFMVWLSTLMAGVVASFVYTFLYFIPCFGQLLLLPAAAAGTFFIYMVGGHALGQALALDKGEAAPTQLPA